MCMTIISLKDCNKSMITISSQDQIWYDGITHPPRVWKKQAGHPKKKWFREESKFLDPGDSPIICSLHGKSGHSWRTCPRADMATEAEQP